ncbi:hypothetical protein ECEC4196_4868, partial [Escherichia coli EC4196]
ALLIYYSYNFIIRISLYNPSFKVVDFNTSRFSF